MSLRIAVGLFATILIVGSIPALWTGRAMDAPFLVAPLGASATLLALSPRHPFSRPVAVVGGNAIATVIGMTAVHFISTPVLAAAVALALAVAVLRAINLTHPPSSGLAVMNALGGSHTLGYSISFLVLDVVISSLLLTLVMYWLNRIQERRRRQRGRRH